jgi:hypothetical protein
MSSAIPDVFAISINLDRMPKSNDGMHGRNPPARIASTQITAQPAARQPSVHFHRGRALFSGVFLGTLLI